MSRPKQPLPTLGDKKGKLTIAALLPPRVTESPQRLWCFCDCGGEKLTSLAAWRHDVSMHCGCERRQPSHLPKCTSHEYKTWQSMWQRCTNKNTRFFENYGGRGIKVAGEWRSFAKFFECLGPRPSRLHSLDRIDNERNYEPGNVKWSTRSEQQLNRRNKKSLVSGGVIKTCMEWSRENNVKYQTIRTRLRNGVPQEHAVLSTNDFKVIYPDGHGPHKLVTYHDRQQSERAWSRELNIPRQFIRKHTKNGLTLSQIVELHTLSSKGGN